MVSPVARVVFPVPVHLASVMPRRLSLYCFISCMTCASLPVWNKVLTFQHPTLMVVFGVRRSTVAVGVKTSFWVWSPSVISSVYCSASLPPPVVVFSLVSVSVASFVLWEWGRWPHAQPSSFIRAWDWLFL